MNCAYDVMPAKRVENGNDKNIEKPNELKKNPQNKQVEGRQKCNILFKTMKVNQQRQEEEQEKKRTLNSRRCYV